MSRTRPTTSRSVLGRVGAAAASLCASLRSRRSLPTFDVEPGGRHRVDERVGALRAAQHLVLGLAAGVVLAVRQHHQHALLALGGREMVEAGDHRVVQRGLAAGWHGVHRGLKQDRRVAGERDGAGQRTVHVLVEDDGESLVVGLVRLGEGLDAGQHHRPARQHARAVVDDQADRHRRVLAAEQGDRLRRAVFDDLKDVARELRHRVAAAVEHRDVEDDEIGFGGEGAGGRVPGCRRRRILAAAGGRLRRERCRPAPAGRARARSWWPLVDDAVDGADPAAFTGQDHPGARPKASLRTTAGSGSPRRRPATSRPMRPASASGLAVCGSSSWRVTCGAGAGSGFARPEPPCGNASARGAGAGCARRRPGLLLRRDARALDRIAIAADLRLRRRGAFRLPLRHVALGVNRGHARVRADLALGRQHARVGARRDLQGLILRVDELLADPLARVVPVLHRRRLACRRFLEHHDRVVATPRDGRPARTASGRSSSSRHGPTPARRCATTCPRA